MMATKLEEEIPVGYVMDLIFETAVIGYLVILDAFSGVGSKG